MRPKLWVELCAGSAAVTLGLIGGARCKPPVSYQGSKQGYKKAILHALGLRCGLGAEQVVLVEAGPWADVWANLIDPEKCKAVAEVIRGWIGEDARALWERLRADAVPPESVEGSAGWLCLSALNALNKPLGEDCKGAGFGANNYGDHVSVHNSMTILSSLRFPPTAVLKGDVAAWGPEEVAKWIYLNGRSFGAKGESAGFDGHDDGGEHWAPSAATFAERLDTLHFHSTTIYKGSAADLEPVPPLPEGTYVYMDPPYLNTAGYAHDLPREAVLTIARKWSDAGATVCVSEAEPLPLDGWHHLEITGARHGQARTFSKQKSEWLTMNREPVVKPMVQQGLFGEVEAC